MRRFGQFAWLRNLHALFVIWLRFLLSIVITQIKLLELRQICAKCKNNKEKELVIKWSKFGKILDSGK